MHKDSFDFVYNAEGDYYDLVVDKKIQKVVEELKALPHDVLIRYLTLEAEKEAKSLIPLNKDYENHIFSHRYVDWDCSNIWQRMLEESKNIEQLLATGEYQTAALMFLQLTKSMCRHFVIDRHWEFFDDMYNPEYAIEYLIEEFYKLAKQGKLPEAVNTDLHEVWKEIEEMESCTDYGVPRRELSF